MSEYLGQYVFKFYHIIYLIFFSQNIKHRIEYVRHNLVQKFLPTMPMFLHTLTQYRKRMVVPMRSVQKAILIALGFKTCSWMIFSFCLFQRWMSYGVCLGCHQALPKIRLPNFPLTSSFSEMEDVIKRSGGTFGINEAMILSQLSLAAIPTAVIVFLDMVTRRPPQASL